MNKTSKFLVFTGLIASATTYLAYKLTNKSSNSKAPSSLPNSDRTNDKKEKTNSNKDSNKVERGNRYSDDRTQMMYKDLGMTEDQKRRFEKDYYAIMGDWERNNPDRDMDAQQQENSHSAALKAVLNEAQYAMYRDLPNKK